MIDLYLFRIKVILPAQQKLFPDLLTRREIILRAMGEARAVEPRKDIIWHIGNVRKISSDDSNRLYFAVGRTTKSTLPKFDDEKSEFAEEEFETSPYTHAYLNANDGILAIGKKSKLARTITGIANKIKEMLLLTDVFVRNGLSLEIEPISDPKDFISSLLSAYSITRYTFYFSRPNPEDVDELFHKPMERYLSASNGNEGETTIKGDDLNSTMLAEMTRSVAASGNDAEARIQIESGAKSIRITLNNKPAYIPINNEELTDMQVIREVELEYRRIRSDLNE